MAPPRAHWPRFVANQWLRVHADGTHTCCVTCGKAFSASSRSNAYKHVKACALVDPAMVAPVPHQGADADLQENNNLVNQSLTAVHEHIHEHFQKIGDRVTTSPHNQGIAPHLNRSPNQALAHAGTPSLGHIAGKQQGFMSDTGCAGGGLLFMKR
ncbi:hypothetical protein Vafri_19022 [Volvox africanus]|uniref:Uncharacterized protein n=1 Tax=Volvox africanus TaxID=51714 RepID=A0A8J4BQQ9_9CHLO|nr:hypothetical protein Vafri_19022 [Volvox africanus]